MIGNSLLPHLELGNCDRTVKDYNFSLTDTSVYNCHGLLFADSRFVQILVDLTLQATVNLSLNYIMVPKSSL